MKLPWNFAGLCLLTWFVGLRPSAHAAGTPSLPHLAAAPLAPSAIAVPRARDCVYVACAGAPAFRGLREGGGRVICYDLTNSVIAWQLPLPGSPSGLCLDRAGKRLFVTCASPESSLCIIDTTSRKIIASIPAGHTSMSPVLSRDEKIVFICNRYDDEVAVIDIVSSATIAHIKVDRQPVSASLSLDGRHLYVANHLHAGRSDAGIVFARVSVVDVQNRHVLKHIPLPNGSTLAHGTRISPDGRFLAVTHNIARFHMPTTAVTHGWMNNSALSIIDVEQQQWLNTVLLDNVELGAATPWGVGWTSDGATLCVTHAGSHELSIIDFDKLLAKLQSLPVKDPAPQPGYSRKARQVSEVPNDLRFLVGLRQRVKLPGKGPRSLVVAGRHAFVGNYFSDSLVRVALNDTSFQHLELSTGAEMTLMRKGEMHFNDATLCQEQWQSCASCHSEDGRVDAMNWDLQNDGVGNPKNVKSLLLSFDTPPVMSMGVRADAAAAIRAGIRYILFTNLPPEYAAAMDSFVKSLKPVPSPLLVNGGLSPAARRGRQLFEDPSVGCVSCHQPPLFTDLKPHDVGTGKFDAGYDQFYTPTLIEAWRTAPYLHDGSAASLREAVVTHNREGRRGRTAHLAPTQIDDLVAYVGSL